MTDRRRPDQQPRRRRTKAEIAADRERGETVAARKRINEAKSRAQKRAQGTL